ncbi:MAG: hypothetical protein COV74_08250 [Candidatus Omnitrophica bacterium CG11_big_fil_rev_8_21_14_0_20_45_26]|uniref:Type II secretion system protein GspF domain-containing protein n=1 Tax=Candidatus Abzuiibacterium crystallinum TaxID=1974748 RepID=A0A2H0LM89_9BACT|nr:MAG: hypothetical protein COV74_08250 [Candidatus Omnitrophica bacterium CG11_big_fil_rev_8_21_14_0_20_45_26]PIW63652.1 MAG: hypothetical protein COW12_09135 [Candidatus Omnitrophica bacterium CG12_big_fil_rev_8_21_14_0_65_45_16]
MKFNVKVKKREEGAKIEQFVREAMNVEDLVGQLQTEGYFVLSVQESGSKKQTFTQQERENAADQSKKKVTKFSEITLFETVKGSDLLSFFIQLIALLKAGVPILRSLGIIEKGIKKGLLKKVLQGAIEKISQGFSLSRALAQYPKVFPPFWFGLIQAGEASGSLPEVLTEIKNYQESSERFKSKLTSAMVYPVILICFCIGALSIFMVKVIPTFEKVFQSFGRNRKLPEVTQLVLDSSRFMQSHFILIVLVIVFFIMAYAYFNRRRESKRWIDSFKLQIPVVSTFITEVAIVRFARGLGTMVRAGTPIIQALEIASTLVGTVPIEDRVERAKESVKKGSGVAMALEKEGAFPVFVTQLISVGEESGQLDRFLEVIANFFEERVNATIQRLSVIIEPMVILFMGVIVGTLVISMFLPLIEISTGGL